MFMIPYSSPKHPRPPTPPHLVIAEYLSVVLEEITHFSNLTINPFLVFQSSYFIVFTLQVQYVDTEVQNAVFVKEITSSFFIHKPTEFDNRIQIHDAVQVTEHIRNSYF